MHWPYQAGMLEVSLPTDKTDKPSGSISRTLLHRSPNILFTPPIPCNPTANYYTPDYCCPKIVPVLGGTPHSVIEPTDDCSVNVAIITDWGNCSVADKGFWWALQGETAGAQHTHAHLITLSPHITDSTTRWFVDWHDGTYDEGCTDYLGPFDPPTHKYSGCNDYYKKDYKGVEVCVTVYYCSSIDSKFRYCSHNADCCDAIEKCLTLY